MDFFAAQDRARRASRWLLLWFFLVVAATIMLVYLVIAPPLAGQGASLWQPGLFFLVAFSVGGVILGGSAWKVAELAAGGGAAVAYSLGGRLATRASADPAEGRLLNLVDEMALAAGIPAPPVYVLENESGINAFAAGARAQEAVVAFTRGALEKLTRDELQGVVAHEFSHILNGDMRLNLRLMGVLHGLFMLATAGRLLLRSGGGRSSGRNRGGLVALGVALIVAGYVGVLAGRLIRAAVSRQREFLADASAVQFTRNPAAVAGALRKIAGEGAGLVHARADEVSHMLFDAGRSFAGWFATHPPLAERIRRIEGGAGFVAVSPTIAPVPGLAAAANEKLAAAFAATPPVAMPAPQAYAQRIGAPAADQVDAARDLIEALPDKLRRAVSTPSGACAVVLALLLSRNAEQRADQLAAVARRHDDVFARQVAEAIADDLAPSLRLPLIELALGALREMQAHAREDFLAAGDAMARADGRVSLGEYVLLRLLRDALVPRTPSPMRLIPGELAVHGALVLSLVAHAGHRDPDAAAAAFGRGASHAPTDGLTLMPRAEMRTEALDRALDNLSCAAPGYRRRLVEALAAVAWHDDRLGSAEAELLAAVCSALDCPVPLPPVLDVRARTGAALSAESSPAATVGLTASPRTPEVALASADRLPVQALVAANLIPVIGVSFFDWDALTLLLTYWLENLVVGAFTYVRMARVGGWTTLFAPGLFFLFHYGFFCAGHGMVLMGIGAMTGLSVDLGAYVGDVEWPGPFVIFQELTGILLWIANERPEMLLALVGFFASHGVSTLVHHFIGNEDRGREVEQIMFDPYRRILVLHIAMIAGMFIVILSGGASIVPVLLLMVAGKIALDLHLHRRAHRSRLVQVVDQAAE